MTLHFSTIVIVVDAEHHLIMGHEVTNQAILGCILDEGEGGAAIRENFAEFANPPRT